MSLRIFVAEDNAVIRSVICALLVARAGWDICGEAADGDDAIEQLKTLKPDIILLDSDMPKKNGIEVTREVMQCWSPPKVVILTTLETEPAISEIFDAGALGYVLKANATHDLIYAVDAVQRGRTYFTPRFAESILKGRLASNGDKATLTDQERGRIRRLALELATPYRNRQPRVRLLHPFTKNAVMVMIMAAALAGGWLTYRGAWGRVVPELNALSVRAGLIPPPPRTAYRGNPKTKVWIDIHTALYYCPGSSLYGHTRRGRFAMQADAQSDHYEAAGQQTCD